MAIFPQVGRNQPRLRIAWWLLVLFLCLGVLLHLFPFYFMMVTLITPAQDTLKMPPQFIPQSPTLAAWRLVFEVTSQSSSSRVVRELIKEPFSVYLMNSLFMTFMTLLLSLPVTALAAYANSKLQRGPITRWTFLFFIGTLMVPAAVTLIPSFLLTRNFPFPMPNPPTIPGSNQPLFAVAAWLQFSSVWDSYLWPLVVLQSTDKLPTSVAIANLMEKFIRVGGTNQQQALGQIESMRDVLEAGLSWNGLMVLGLLQTIPIFLMFIVCREYLLRGIRVRGLK